MIYAENAAAVQKARAGFSKKWRLRCPAVIASLEKAGDELFTFLRFPVAQWKGPAHDERAGADQRRIPPPSEDARQSPEPGCRDAVAVSSAAQRSDPAAPWSGITRWSR
jgi:hypothetical protein